MAERIERLKADFLLRVEDHNLSFSVVYVPVSNEREIPELAGNFKISGAAIEPHLRERLNRVVDFISSRLASRQYDLQGQIRSLSPSVDFVMLRESDLQVALGGGSPLSQVHISRKDLTDGQQRLVDSVISTSERLAWQHLADRLEAHVSAPPHVEVLVSYRSTKQAFAEALAIRLGREGVTPFFDKWDVKAGDSIPGKIDEAFALSTATVIILSDDFTGGHWATAETETAITKCIEEGYKVIPVLYEHCSIPELLGPLRHVDFSDHDPQMFESKFGELIDAIYGLELNPFRS